MGPPLISGGKWATIGQAGAARQGLQCPDKTLRDHTLCVDRRTGNITKNMTSYMTDPRPIHERRAAVAEAIKWLSQ